ncbi:MAG: hypothetical protein CMF41_04875 [Legionellales bacterium]|nr:hypothetical protein [Legionellales bacterium]|tara:strand:+ start:593 stop:1063 length:471 start_codon:yes stop_codon:yes gene_type:complete
MIMVRFLIFIVFGVSFACDVDEVSTWSKKLASNLYTLDAKNYSSQLASNRKMFEPELWARYMKDFEASDYPNSITKDNLKISSSILGVEQINHSDKGCNVVVKVNAIFTGQEKVMSQTLRLTMTIEEVNKMYELVNLSVEKIGDPDVTSLKYKCNL